MEDSLKGSHADSEREASLRGSHADSEREASLKGACTYSEKEDSLKGGHTGIERDDSQNGAPTVSQGVMLHLTTELANRRGRLSSSEDAQPERCMCRSLINLTKLSGRLVSWLQHLRSRCSRQRRLPKLSGKSRTSLQ